MWDAEKMAILWFVGKNSKAAHGHNSLNQPQFTGCEDPTLISGFTSYTLDSYITTLSLSLPI